MKLEWPSSDAAKVAIANYEVISILGAGGFGTCYKALSLETNQIVALKKLNRSSSKKAAMLQSFQCETRQEIFDFDHPNIGRLLHASGTKDQLDEMFLVMEFIEGKCLQSVLDDPSLEVSYELRLDICMQIARGLAYIHKRGIAHLDLKPANVMLTETFQCKLVDFGCSEAFNDYHRDKTSHLTGTFAFRAPELLKGGAPSPGADIYSLGITMWQMWSRQFPFSGVNQHAVIFRVVSANLRPALKPDASIEPGYKELMTTCWSGDPATRSTALEVQNALKSLRQG